MAMKHKNEKAEPKRVKVAFSEAITFASEKAKGVAEVGTASLKGAQKVVQARPWTTAAVTVGLSALIGGLALICGRSRES